MYVLSTHYMVKKHSSRFQGICSLVVTEDREWIIKIWFDLLAFKSTNQSVYIYEMKIRDNHQAFIDMDADMDINIDTNRVIGPKEMGS